MRASITDSAALRSLRLEDVEAYLRSRGWSKTDGAGARLSLWVMESQAAPFDELVLPTSSDVVDYATRLAEVLRILENVESRSQLSIVTGIRFAFFDVIRVSRPTDDDHGESIGLDEGVGLVEQARALVTSAACTAVKPHRVIPSRRPPLALDYMNRVRMGHTEHGSFTVTVASKVEPQRTLGSPALEEEWGDPFPRRVTKTLAGALTAASEAAAEVARTGGFEAFERAVELGVSADMCEAVARLSRSGGLPLPVTIGIEWAPSMPQDEVKFERTSFSPEASAVMEQAARAFREAAPQEGVTVVGLVVTLHREPDSSEGVVTVAGVIAEAEKKTVRQVAVRVDVDTYGAFLDAHKQEVAVSFTADVEKSGRGYVARNVEGLKLLRG